MEEEKSAIPEPTASSRGGEPPTNLEGGKSSSEVLSASSKGDPEPLVPQPPGGQDENTIAQSASSHSDPGSPSPEPSGGKDENTTAQSPPFTIEEENLLRKYDPSNVRSDTNLNGLSEDMKKEFRSQIVHLRRLQTEGFFKTDDPTDRQTDKLTDEEIEFIGKHELDPAGRSKENLKNLDDVLKLDFLRSLVDQHKNVLQKRDHQDLRLVDEEVLSKDVTVKFSGYWPFYGKAAGVPVDADGPVQKAYYSGLALQKDENYSGAIIAYKEAIKQDTPTDADEKSFWVQACTNLGSIRLAVDEFRDDNEAMRCFLLGSGYKHPTCMYFYGRSLVHGIGGAKRNIPEGVALLNRAGARGIGQAYFELGSIYENGVTTSGEGGNLARNVAMAQGFYGTAMKSYERNVDNHFDFIPGRLRDGHIKNEAFVSTVFSVKNLLPTEGWHVVEDAVGSVVGDRFNWSLAGQAFLFGAAATLSTILQPNHYSPLLVLLPVLGLILALFSTVHILEAMVRNTRRRQVTNDMLRTKIQAYEEHLLAAVLYNLDESNLDEKENAKDALLTLKCLRDPQTHKRFQSNRQDITFAETRVMRKLLNLCLCRSAHLNLRFERKMKQLASGSKELAQEVNNLCRYKWTVLMLRTLTRYIENMVMTVAIVFLAAWCLLLLNEILSMIDGCGEWWKSACRGSNSDCKAECSECSC